MVEFEKGFWNLNELEVSEWLEPRTAGFALFDVETLKEKILEDLYELMPPGNLQTEITKIINKRFGF